MIKNNSSFEDILNLVINTSFKPEEIGIEIILNPNQIYVYDIAFDECEDGDIFSFDWLLFKDFSQQSQKTKETLNMMFNEYGIY